MNTPDFLQKILAEKFCEVEAARARVSEEELWDAALVAGPRRNFVSALSPPGSDRVSVIAEIKRASPSKGPIRPDLSAAALAASYEEGGAAALSVLTESRFFGALPDDLSSARQGAALPVLRKDFIVTTYQVFETLVLGADAMLLIVAAVSDDFLAEALSICHEHRLPALVEVHSGEELARALAAGARIVGINNRNLKTFVTDIGTTVALAKLLPPGVIAVSESGIRSRDDVLRIRDAGVSNFLIGESLVRSEDPVALLAELTGRGAP